LKIDPQNPLLRAGQTPPRDQATKVQSPAQAGGQEGGPGAMTHLRHGTTDTGQDIDMVRVEEIREAIREGRLEIRADRIADGLVDSIRDMLDKG
jgi:negative regulator of flagellin synthesis FlgM